MRGGWCSQLVTSVRNGVCGKEREVGLDSPVCTTVPAVSLTEYRFDTLLLPGQGPESAKGRAWAGWGGGAAGKGWAGGL